MPKYRMDWGSMSLRRRSSAIGTTLERKCLKILAPVGTTDRPSGGHILQSGKVCRRMVYLQRRAWPLRHGRLARCESASPPTANNRDVSDRGPNGRYVTKKGEEYLAGGIQPLVCTWLRRTPQYGWVAHNDPEPVEVEMHLCEDCGVRRVLVLAKIIRRERHRGRDIHIIFLDKLTRIHRQTVSRSAVSTMI